MKTIFILMAILINYSAISDMIAKRDASAITVKKNQTNLSHYIGDTDPDDVQPK